MIERQRQVFNAWQNEGDLKTDNSENKQKIIFVTGKGGVGKSTVAAGFALSFADAGFRTLLVELGDFSYFKDYLSLSDVSYDPHEVGLGTDAEKAKVDLALWTGGLALREYARHLIKLDSLVALFFDNQVMKTFINVAPGLPELALTGKITSGHRKIGPALNYDRIVIDAYATGHMMALLKAPRGMAETIRMGPMGDQSRGIQKILSDPSICEYKIVTLPEELPVTETMELCEQIEQEMGIRPQIILNKIISSGLSESELESIRTSTDASAAEFADFVLTLEHRQTEFRAKLRTLDPQLKEVPFVMETEPGQVVQKISEALR